jgi:hypothetical protein
VLGQAPPAMAATKRDRPSDPRQMMMPHHPHLVLPLVEPHQSASLALRGPGRSLRLEGAALISELALSFDRITVLHRRLIRRTSAKHIPHWPTLCEHISPPHCWEFQRHSPEFVQNHGQSPFLSNKEGILRSSCTEMTKLADAALSSQQSRHLVSRPDKRTGNPLQTCLLVELV